MNMIGSGGFSLSRWPSTCSLVISFSGATSTAYAQFVLLCSLFILSRPSNPEQYKSTLQVFQILVMILSCLGVGQFVAQFMLDGTKLIMFYGIIPDIFFSNAVGYHTTHTLEIGSSLLKANGIFLQEPGTFSQVTALGLLIEVLEFRRPRYLVVMTLGFLLAYSGTGLMMLALFLPLASLHHRQGSPSGLSRHYIRSWAVRYRDPRRVNFP